MLKQRLIAVIIGLPVLVVLVTWGGWPFYLMVLGLNAIAAWEYWHMFQVSGYSPSRVLLTAGTVGVTLHRILFGRQGVDILLSLMVLACMAWHLLDYERGRKTAAVDFAITLGGVLYIGWLGAYMISLRDLPDGKWWMLMVIPTIALADAGAYLIGQRFGRHKMAPRLSPKKSWEGLFGGALSAIVGGALLAWLWGLAFPVLTPLKGALLGLVLGLLTPLGDLGESMLKRAAGVKDSSNLIPGHGGILDRLDSWLWGAVIGFYMIIFLF
ncbi:MAG TPA: phosphatidate cytidylyltransferase [Anaerolineaceae bacterium]|nr:phosphatidate cytidylyltransferase [Anaerolineaceae bacterium]HPN53441.1 phosphatidate cytidylyltransferase [Anaerolineaceae bacterium]